MGRFFSKIFSKNWIFAVAMQGEFFSSRAGSQEEHCLPHLEERETFPFLLSCSWVSAEQRARQGPPAPSASAIGVPPPAAPRGAPTEPQGSPGRVRAPPQPCSAPLSPALQRVPAKQKQIRIFPGGGRWKIWQLLGRETSESAPLLPHGENKPKLV